MVRDKIDGCGRFAAESYMRIRSGIRRWAMLWGLVNVQRLSSYPFISGDTFRDFADFKVESSVDYENFLSKLSGLSHNVRTVFVSADFAEVFLINFPTEFGADLTLIIHNGDQIPVQAIEENYARFRRIFCVNWLGDPEYASPLPIGLENQWRNNFGKVQNFKKSTPSKREELVTKHRKFLLLVSFSIHTNKLVRAEARRTFSQSSIQGSHLRKFTGRSYRRRLLNTAFVVSPPGNGPDCHRTWEALYSGAIPIVLSSAWPFGAQDLPVLEVENWEQAVVLLQREREALYRQISLFDSEQIYAEYYLNKIRESSVAK